MNRKARVRDGKKSKINLGKKVVLIKRPKKKMEGRSISNMLQIS